MANESLNPRKQKSRIFHPWQWKANFRAYIEKNEDHCLMTHTAMPPVTVSKMTFPTESTYDGQWNLLGINGHGVYHLANGVIYEGGFEDGIYHGPGKLIYPDGTIIYGEWKHGDIVHRKLVFSDGVEYDEENWKYCEMPDRRYKIEHDIGLQPAGKSFSTPTQPPRDIPFGFYDTGDGLYDPKTTIVYDYEDSTRIVRATNKREQKWILDNCRMTPEHCRGFYRDLYETWFPPKQNKCNPKKVDH